jgi:hypothetical protein
LNCREGRETECMEYSACTVLAESTILDAPNDMISMSCTTESVNTKSGLKDCHINCAQHLCCFQDPSLPSSCTGIYGESLCSKYSPCSVLIGETAHIVYDSKGDPYLKALINNYCAEENIKTEEGIAQCSHQCDKRSCCFGNDDEIYCYETDKAWCDEALACKNLEMAINNFVATDAPNEDEDSRDDEAEMEGQNEDGSSGNNTVKLQIRDDDTAPGDEIALAGQDDDGKPGDMEALKGLDENGALGDDNAMAGENDDGAPGDQDYMTSYSACTAISILADAGVSCQEVCDSMICCKDESCDETSAALFDCESDFDPCLVEFPDKYS